MVKLRQALLFTGFSLWHRSTWRRLSASRWLRVPPPPSHRYDPSDIALAQDGHAKLFSKRSRQPFKLAFEGVFPAHSSKRSLIPTL